jgi:hypothetical protein
MYSLNLFLILILRLNDPSVPLIRPISANKYEENSRRSTRINQELSQGRELVCREVFENWVLRRIFGPKRDEVIGGWRNLHNKELHNLYCSPSMIRIIKSRRMRWTGHVARMGEKRNAYRILVGKQEGKIPLGRPRRRWEDNISMDLREIVWIGMDWIDLAQDRDHWRALVNTIMNLRVP